MAGKVLTEFRREFHNSVNTAIVAAFGFLIALSWRDLITKYITKLSSLSSLNSQLISTAIITFISVLGIFITTKILSPKKEEAQAAEKK
ncbi:MAG: hypothetical protein KKB62_01300 [Nanoarchaeota archaeon]|nr:hypothetical protein [Nanoarchaeota archaeon]